MGLKEVLGDTFSHEELELVKSSFDIVGDVAVVEIPEELDYKEAEIAAALIKLHPRVKTVCRKLGERKGTYRLRDIKVIYGNGTETIHKEYGCQFKVDVKAVYFSPRESTERQLIKQQLTDNETVMVFFAGVGPYAVILAKNTNIKKVYGIELNKKGYACMKENVKLNKLQRRFIPVHGDVKKKAKGYFGKCDRVLMPLPRGSAPYLDLAMKCLKKRGGIIHFYYITPDLLFSQIIKQAKKEAKKLKKNVRVLNKRQVLPFGPGRWKNCIDLKVY